MPHLNGVIETCIYCDDLNTAEAFYCGVLGLTTISRTEGRGISFAVGRTVLLVFVARATAKGGVLPPHGSTGSTHFAFQIEPDEYSPWLDHLRAAGVIIEHEHQWEEWLGNARSIYFRDPGGNLVELITRPAWEKYFGGPAEYA